MKTDFQNRYSTALNTIPAPGNGCHTHLLTVANYGILAGIEPATIHQDIRQSIPQGGRFVPDKEIEAAIIKAASDIEFNSDTNGNQYRFTITAPPKPKPLILPDYTQRLIDKAGDIDEADIWEFSPCRLTDDPLKDWRLLIETLFEPADCIFIGSLYDTDLRQVKDVVNDKRPAGQFLCPNTFYGDGKRQDSDILTFRYCIVEFDNIPIADQIRFWAMIPLPVAALIYTGGKSIHALIKLEGVNSLDDWQRIVKNELYTKRLAPLGVDTATSNPSRTTRTPSVPRGDNMQRLLYLNNKPDGKPILK